MPRGIREWQRKAADVVTLVVIIVVRVFAESIRIVE